MWLRFLVTVTLVAVFVPPSVKSGDWNDPNSDQFHIQTDEGPERYFRYQTHNGQYRKEKRLEDGTVVGSYGWIDSNGLLRLQDYIADNAGYRILRTKDVFVGRNRPISQAIKAAKKVPASGGVLSKTNSYPTSTYLPSFSTVKPYVDISENYIGSTTESPISSSTVGPFISTTQLPPRFSSTTPATVYIPPTKPTVQYIPSTTSSVVAPHQYISTTPSPHIFLSATSTPTVYVSSHGEPETVYIPSKSFPPQNNLPNPTIQPYVTSSIPPSLHSNSLDYSSDPQYEHYDNEINPYRYQNGPTYPIDRNGNTYNGYNSIGESSQYQTYDGVSVTNDGFRYYIPRAYHEEQNVGNKKSGSFGYIDPFGIRRVVYYNAGERGFEHRKNNRYVGFDATPYDPRPIYK